MRTMLWKMKLIDGNGRGLGVLSQPYLLKPSEKERERAKNDSDHLQARHVSLSLINLYIHRSTFHQEA